MAECRAVILTCMTHVSRTVLIFAVRNEQPAKPPYLNLAKVYTLGAIGCEMLIQIFLTKVVPCLIGFWNLEAPPMSLIRQAHTVPG